MDQFVFAYRSVCGNVRRFIAPLTNLVNRKKSVLYAKQLFFLSTQLIRFESQIAVTEIHRCLSKYFTADCIVRFGIYSNMLM